MSSSDIDPIKDQWRVTDRVLFHYFFGCCVGVLLPFCIANDFDYKFALEPPLVLSFLGLLICLWFVWGTKKGRNHHLMINAIFAFFLYCFALFLWEMTFSRTGKFWSFRASGVFQIFAALFGVTTVAAWLRCRARSFSLQEAAFGFVVVSVVLFATQSILKLDRLSDYRRELSTARKFGAFGATLKREGWSVVSIEIPKGGLTDEDLKSISEFPNLSSVSLGGNPIGDATIHRISNPESLSLIDLTETNATDKSLEYLAGATNITRVCLRGTKVTDDGLDHLAHMRRIWYLDLRDTDISDAGLEKLVNLKLSRIYLQNTKVTKMGMDLLAEELPRVQIYGTLNGSPYYRGQ